MLNSRNINPSIAFKFWHASVNGNDLRINSFLDSTSNSNNDETHEIVLPGKDGDLKRYFLVDFYPNPSSDFITITSSGEVIKPFTLIDLTGNKILSKDNLNVTRTEVALNEIASGIYYLNIKSHSGIIKIFKVMKL